MSDEIEMDERFQKLLAYLSSDHISVDELLGESSTIPDDRFIVSQLYRFDLPALEFASGKDSNQAQHLIDSLVDSDLLTGVPNAPGVFMVSERLRRDISSPRVSPDEVTSLHSRMVGYFKEQGDQWQLELLFHQLVSAPDEAMAEFMRRWRRCLPAATDDGGASVADSSRAIDGLSLAEARELIGVVQIQQNQLPQKYRQLVDDCSTWTNVWSEHCDAWFRSRRLLRRARVEKPLLDLLNIKNQEKRILELHAPGGSGKTMALRWLITHHCMPRKLPIAHFDFDHLVGKSQHPSTILSRCIKQLSSQLPGLLTSLVLEGADLDESSKFEALESVAIVRGSNQSFHQHTENLLEALAAALNSQPSVTIIVVDTFEVAILQGTTAVPEFLAALSRLVQKCPLLRLIVSGRFAVPGGHFGDEISQYSANEHQAYFAALSVFRIPQFNFQESLDYLTSRGWIVKPEQLHLLTEVDLASTAGRAERAQETSPFHLAMLADLWKSYQGDDLPAADLAKLESELLANMRDVKVIYLIERVISRIDDVTLRWMVRYGVVPRNLTKDFFLEVILPQLHKVHEGQSQWDTPALDRFPTDLRERSLYVEPSAMSQMDPNKAWDKLCSLADTNEWLERIDLDSLLLHPCIKQPMRALLKSHPILLQIHRDAEKYFRRLHDDSGETELIYEQEAIYHQLQYSDGADVDKTCARLRLLYEEEQFERVAACAQVIIDCYHSPDEDRVQVPAETLRECYQFVVKSALSLFDISREDDLRSHWMQVASAGCLKLKELTSDYMEFQSWEALFKVRQSTDQREIESQVSLVNQSIHRHDDLWRRTEALAYFRLDVPKCSAYLEGMLEERQLRNTPTAPLVSAWLIELLSSAYADFGVSNQQLLNLRKQCTYAAGSPLAVSRGRYAVASLLQRLGRLSSAALWLRNELGQEIAKWPDLELLVICGSARSYPASTLQELLKHNNELGRADLARKSTILAWLSACLFDVNEAIKSLGLAIEAFRKLGFTRSVSNVQLNEAELWLHHFGNVRNCGRKLEEHKRSIRSHSDREDWRSLRSQLLDFEVAILADNPSDATSMAELIRLGRKSLWPTEKLRCAVTLLAYQEPHSTVDTNLIDLLIEAMQALPDWSARSQFPWLLRRQPFTVTIAPPQQKRFLELVDFERSFDELTEEDITEDDQAWCKLSLAYLLRFLGFSDKARACWRDARLALASSLAGKREVWNLAYLLNGEVPEPFELAGYADQPVNLRAVVALEQAENAMQLGELDLSRQWLTEEFIRILSDIPGDFRARCQLVRAAWIGQNSDSDEARNLRRSAAAEFDQIGNRLMSNKCESKVAFLDHSWQPLPYLCATFNSQDRTNKLSPLGRLYSRLTEINENIELAWEQTGDVVPHTLVARLAEEPRSLMRTLFDECFRENGDANRDWVDWVIGGDHLGAQSLPWELGVDPARIRHSRSQRSVYRSVASIDYPIRWLQAALYHHLEHRPKKAYVSFWSEDLNSDLAIALQRVSGDIEELRRVLLGLLNDQSKADLPGNQIGLTAAVLTGPDVDRESRGQTSSTNFRNCQQLVELYEYAGIPCELITGANIADLVHGTNRSVDILHVYATYVQRRSLGVIEPDLVSFVEYGAPIGGLQGRSLPLLILDGPTPDMPHEQMRQVLLRNATGTLLARLAQFPNIIGIGQSQASKVSAKAYTSFIQSIAGQRTLIESIQAFARSEGQNDLPANLGGHLALWTADPDLTVLPVYRS